MKNKPLVWVLAAASVLGLTLLSAQQTGAAWSSAETISGDTITSGRLELAVGNSGVETQNFTFSAFGGGPFGAGDYSQAPLTIFNKGNVPMRYRIQNTAQSSAAMPLKLDISAVGSEGACPAAPALGAGTIYSGDMVGAAFPTAGAQQWRTLAPSTSEVLCMTGTVGPNPPSGAESTVTFSVAAQSQ